MTKSAKQQFSLYFSSIPIYIWVLHAKLAPLNHTTDFRKIHASKCVILTIDLPGPYSTKMWLSMVQKLVWPVLGLYYWKWPSWELSSTDYLFYISKCHWSKLDESSIIKEKYKAFETPHSQSCLWSLVQGILVWQN